MARPALDPWLPDRASSKRDVWLIGAALFLGAVSVPSSGAVAWPWVVVGFAANALVLGYAESSAVGQRIGDSLRALDPPIRTVVGVAIMLLLIYALVRIVPDNTGRAIAVGGCAFVALSLTINAVLGAGAGVDRART